MCRAHLAKEASDEKGPRWLLCVKTPRRRPHSHCRLVKLARPAWREEGAHRRTGAKVLCAATFVGRKLGRRVWREVQ